jgi:hypothetical protein
LFVLFEEPDARRFGDDASEAELGLAKDLIAPARVPAKA